MSSTLWLVGAATAHAVLALAAAIAVFRVKGYSAAQRAWQIVIALALPVLGAIIVLAAVRAALTDTPGPDSSTFEPQSYNGD
jgi:O-antigen ligase